MSSMRKTISILFIALSLLLLLALFVAAQEPNTPPPKGPDLTPNISAPEVVSHVPPVQIDRALLPKIEPQLLKKLLVSGGEPVSFITYLKIQTNPAAVVSTASSVNPQADSDPLLRRMAIVNTLQETARNTQAGVLQTLNAPAGLSGQSAATDVKSLWIVNAVAAKGNLDTVLALAARPDIQVIRLDKEIKISQPTELSNQHSKFNIQNFSPEWGISKIRADLVHNALGFDGTGIIVANIDSGVDWQHPALQTNYRGYTGPGKLPVHTYSWFDATGEGAAYPIDSNGHGTHTMGTIAGTSGTGVAPGATWIAAKAFDSSGAAQSSWLHQAFQWMLAPNGDTAQAPHIVNNSWSSTNGFSTEFEQDINALVIAGIYPVFAAGNNGPASGTVGSPGSLNNAFAVGATTIDDEIATFSGRGPSPWGKIKPEVSAPGKDVRSTLPGGAYGEFDGTSMAAPHAAGLAALLLQASPTLANNVNNLSNIMMSTAVPLGSPIPNNNFGWGRIDAYNAVLSVAPAGIVQGVVTDATTTAAISNPLIQIIPSLGGPTVNTTGNTGGAYTQGLAPNTYDITASAFGYQPATAKLINVITGATKIQNFSLTPQPTGYLTGTVKEQNTNSPLAATITVNNTPVSINTNPVDGSYNLQLPAGVYTITAVAAQHRISKATNITITAGLTTNQNFLLDTAPSILLVDSGKWYQESEIGFYRQALDDALYSFDTWQITKPFAIPNDIPPAATLANYDIVIWSSPFDAPGYIGADDEIETYLNSGGKLLLSGQDVAYFDGGGYLFSAPYLKNYLKVSYVKDDSGITTINGATGEPFDGLSLTITGGDGADNQTWPDVIANADNDFAGPLLSYNSNELAGLHTGLCVPYRTMFFAFGFEAINSRADRSQVMERTIDWLMQPPQQAGTELTPKQETLIGNFGTTVSHTIRLRNIGTTTDTFTLTLTNLGPNNWPTGAIPPSVPLNSCQSQTITVNVQIPSTKTWHISDTITLLAQSANNPATTDVATRTTKTPAPVLLVDDDRWYSFAAEFKESLEANNIPYDYWNVPKSWVGPVAPSPPLDTLQMYPITVWYTAYDWFDPLDPTEEDRLINYLNGGGRLFFSGQDFLYRHLIEHGNYDTFAQDYLGIQAHTEDYSSTLTIGQLRNPVGTHLGPYPLTFPPGYTNWTDALTPTATAQLATRGQENQPNGLTNAGIGPTSEHWHTNFLAYGPELMAANDRARLMQRSLGWLSWLGSSTVEPNTTATVDGSLVTYTATVTNNGLDALATAYFTATFPAELTLNTYHSDLTLSSGTLSWSGPLAKNQGKVLTYTANIAGSLPLGTVISQTSWLAYPQHSILFDRIATVNVNFPNLSTSTMSVTPAQDIEENDVLTYTIILRNSGVVNAPAMTTTNTLPQVLNLTEIDPPGSGNVISSGNSFTWTTSLAQGQATTLTFRATVSGTGTGGINNVAYVNDGFNDTVELSALATFKSLPIYLPIIFKK